MQPELVERGEGIGAAARRLFHFLFGFKGRSSRLPYAVSQLGQLGGTAVYWWLYVWPSMGDLPAGPSAPFDFLARMWPLFLPLPTVVALSARRAHDLGLDFIGARQGVLFWLKLMFDEGQPGENRFGPAPHGALRKAEGSATQKP